MKKSKIIYTKEKEGIQKMGFNESQKQAILHGTQEGDEALMVVSSAGSGKSRTLIGKAVKMVQDGKRNIGAISFTNNTAEDLCLKLKAYGIDSYVESGTFHNICGKILRREGYYTLSKRLKIFDIENKFKKIILDKKKIDMDDIMGFISYQKNDMKTPSDKFAEKESIYSEKQLRECFKVYEELKTEQQAYDLDDYLLLGYEVLLKNPGKYTFDYLLVDEAQDSNEIQWKIIDLLCPSGRISIFGDAQQCFPIGTLIKTENGDKEIQDITINDKIIVGKGWGDTTSVNPTKIISRLYNGDLISIKTKSGKNIKCTPNHIIFANSDIKKSHYVYLMYSDKLGFRIGKSSRYKSGNGFEHRLRAEGGNKVWCLKVFDDKEDAIFYENYVSYQYGIPQYVFKYDKSNTRLATLPQDKIDKLFLSIDTIPRGKKLLDDMNMYFDYPHYIPNGSSKVNDLTIGINLFGSHVISKGKLYNYVGHQHEFSISNTNKELVEFISKNIQDINLKTRTNGNGLTYYGIRKNGSNQDELVDLGNKVASLKEGFNLKVRTTISKSKDKMEMYPASNIREGMDIVCYCNNELINDEVIEISKEHYEGLVYDINVSSYRNYIANDLCVHNCMYGFRGSKPQLFMDFYKTHNTKIINMNINYRSNIEIVERSNHFIQQYYGDYEYYKDAVPNSTENATIELMVNDTVEQESFEVVDKIQSLLGLGYKGNEIAVLYRNNTQGQYVENELKTRGIDYFTEKNGSFFDRKEIDIIMCVLRLIDNKHDDSAYETLFRYRVEPFTFVPNTVLDDIIRYSGENGISHIDASGYVHCQPRQQQSLRAFKIGIQKLIAQHNNGYSLLQLIENIMTTFKMVDYLKNQYPNIEDVKERIASLENLKKFIRSNTLDSFLKFVYETNTGATKENSEDKVQLMTIHKSKGLQWRAVIIVGLQTEKFPSKRSSIEEECNVFYVACTRPICRLYLSQIGNWNQFCSEYFGEEYEEMK